MDFGNLLFDLENQRFGGILAETFWVKEEEYSQWIFLFDKQKVSVKITQRSAASIA